jgi:hypothetical protein
MAILPLSTAGCSRNDERVTTSEFSREDGPRVAGERPRGSQSRRSPWIQQTDQPTGPPLLVLTDPDNSGRLMASPNRRWVRLATRLFASSLDRQLAQGHSPETHRLRAARADVLVSMATRHELAEDLTNVLAQAQRAPAGRDPRAPLNRDSIAACGPEIEDTRRALLAPRPISARGTAMVSCLLSDGTGPLYNSRRSAELAAVLKEALAILNSTASF